MEGAFRMGISPFSCWDWEDCWNFFSSSESSTEINKQIGPLSRPFDIWPVIDCKLDKILNIFSIKLPNDFREFYLGERENFEIFLWIYPSYG